MEDDEQPQGIFISTQIQSRFEEIDEESRVLLREKSKTPSEVFLKFANVESDLEKNSLPVIRRSQSVRQDPKLQMPTAEKKRKGNQNKRKKLSVTDMMVRKMSGKPSKFRKVKAKANGKQQLDANGNDDKFNDVYDVDDDDDDNDSDDSKLYDVIREDEWRRVDYRFLTFKRSEQHETASFDSANDLQYDDGSLWNLSNHVPMDTVEMQSLISERRQAKIQQVHAFEPPITLSQLIRTHSTHSSPNDEPNTDIIDLSEDLEEIACSSEEEGSLILLNPPSQSPILIISDSEDETEKHPIFVPKSTSIEIFGNDLKLGDNCMYNVRLIRGHTNAAGSWTKSKNDDEDVVFDSDDEVLQNHSRYILQIRR
jgi:hypothetical protein